MKTKCLSIFLLFSISSLTAQIGVNTTDPKATLEVVGKPEIASEPDGIIAPKLTREQLIAKTAYAADQVGAIVYVTDLTGTTNSATQKVLAVGYYYFDGSIWNYMNSSVSQFNFGYVKSGFQTTDHNGWVKLDGRAISSLTAGQQARATALGLGANLPDATNAFLTQNGASLATVNGSNTRTIARENLPNVNLITNTVSAGTPSGSVAVSPIYGLMSDSQGTHGHKALVNYDGSVNNPSAQGWPAGNNHSSIRSSNRGGSATSSITGSPEAGSTGVLGLHYHTVPSHSHTAVFSGNAFSSHNHTVALGGSNAPLDVTPRSLSVNIFMYLGE